MNRKNILTLFLFFSTVSITLTLKPNNKKAVFVISVGRSGTSCMTGILNIMGVELGTNLKPGDKSNPKGYFEHIPTTNIDRTLLGRLGSGFYTAKPNLYQSISQQITTQIVTTIKEHILHYFGNYQFWGVKDPQITILARLYAQACIELGITPYFIAMVREPEEVVESFAKYDPRFSKEHIRKQVDIYFDYIRQVEANYNCLIVNFNDLINNTESVLAQLCNFLPDLTYDKKTQSKIDGFLDKDLKHHTI